MGVRSGVTARPDLYHPVLRRPASLPPEHRVYVRQVGQRHVRRQRVRGAGEVQLSTVLVDFVVLQATEGFVGGEDHFAAILPVAMVVLLLVRVRAVVVAATFLEEGVRDAFLSLVFPQVLPDFARILQRGSATVQTAVMMLPA